MADKLTTEELLENQEYVDTLFDYAERQGKRLATREDALENFLGDYRGVQANTALALKFSNDVENIRDEEERKKLGKLYKTVDEDLENFAGRQTGLQTVTEYGVKGILDPLNIFGLGVGKVVASTIGRAGIKKLISESFKKKAVTSPIKQGIKAGALTEGGIGVTQGLLLEDLKGEDALGYQDDINYGNVALQGGIGAISGGVLGGLGAKLGQSATRRIDDIAQEAEASRVAKSTQNKVAQSKDVQSFLEKTNPDTNKNYIDTDVIGTYVESPTKGTTLLTENAENYGTYGRIMDVEDGQATIEFIPTKYSKTKNPDTGTFDGRVQIAVPLNEVKATSLKNKDTYLKQFVEEYGLFFDKAGIENGKQLLKNARTSEAEIEKIFTNTLSQDAYEDLTRFVFDAGQSIQQTMPDSKLAKRIEVTLDDPTKRVTEKVATLLEIGQKNKELLSDSVNKALASSGRSIDEVIDILKADIAVSAGKLSTQSDISKLLNPTSEINKKLSRMQANQTESQKQMLKALAKERELEKQMARKFGVSVDLWRSFLVTQPATTFRNIFGSALRVPGESLSSFVDRFMIKTEADALGIDVPAYVQNKDVALLAKNILSPYESVQLAQMVSKSFPEADRQLFKLFDDYFASTLDQKTGAGNVLKTINYVSQKANVLNRMQDRAIKSAGFMTELDNQVKVAIRRGEITDPDIKGIEDVIRQDKMNLLNDTMVSKSLEFAYKLTYQTRNAGDDLIIGGKMINQLQAGANRLAIVKLGIPFPNFIFNGLVYNLNRGLGFGAAKAAVNARRIAKFDDVAIKKAANRSKQIKRKIDKIKKLSSTKVKQIQERAGDKNFINTQLKKLTNELDELDAAAGKRLTNVEDLRKGIVETIEGVTFISAAYAIRENFGGARYDEIKVGNNSINVGPLFPLTPYLFIAEAIRKVINDEPLDKTFVGEGIEALTGFQTDRAGPISKFVGGLRKTLEVISSKENDYSGYNLIGKEIGALGGYIAKGYLSPGIFADKLVQTIGSKELRQTYDRDFQNIISEESDTLSGEVIRGAFNEFAKQMFRGTSAQGILGGSKDPAISVTGKEQKIQSLPFKSQLLLPGVADVPPRDSVGEELERLGIPSWKLARRSSIPEYTRLFKIKLGKESEKYVKPIVESRKYKALPFKIQLQIIDNLYNGDKGDMSPEAQRAYRTFGPIYNNLKDRVSDEIKNEYKLLDELHKFRTRNSKTEISRSYEEAERKGILPPLKYLGEDTADNRNVAEARDQSDKLKKFQTIIDDPRYKMGEYINRAKGGYVSQMDTLGFAEGGNVGMKGGTVLGKTADLNHPMTEAEIEAGRRLKTSGSPLTRALGPGVNYALEAISSGNPLETTEQRRVGSFAQTQKMLKEQLNPNTKQQVDYAKKASKEQKDQVPLNPLKKEQPVENLFNDNLIKELSKVNKKQISIGTTKRSGTAESGETHKLIKEGKVVSVRINLNSNIKGDAPVQKVLSVHDKTPAGPVLADKPYVTVKPTKDEPVVFLVNQKARGQIASREKAKYPMMGVRGGYSKETLSLNPSNKTNNPIVEIGFNPGKQHLPVEKSTGFAVIGSNGPTLIVGSRFYTRKSDLIYARKKDAPVPDQVGKTGPRNLKTDVDFQFKKGGIMTRRL